MLTLEFAQLAYGQVTFSLIKHPLKQRADSLGKTLMLGKIEGRKYWGGQRMKWLDSIIDSMDMNLRKHREIVKDREAWHASVHGMAKSYTQVSD